MTAQGREQAVSAASTERPVFHRLRARSRPSAGINRCQEEALRAEWASLQYRHSRGKARPTSPLWGAEYDKLLESVRIRGTGPCPSLQIVNAVPLSPNALG